MKPATFVKHLAAVSESRALTAGDLAIWFGRPRATVYSWLFMGHRPVDGPVLVECERRLAVLKKSKAFPVPYAVTKRQRRDYILKAYQDAHARRLPESHPTGARV